MGDCKKFCVNGLCRLQNVTKGGTNDHTNDLVDALIKDYNNPEDLIGEPGLLKQLTKQLLERAMQAQMTELLDYYCPAEINFCNGKNKELRGVFEVNLIRCN